MVCLALWAREAWTTGLASKFSIVSKPSSQMGWAVCVGIALIGWVCIPPTSVFLFPLLSILKCYKRYHHLSHTVANFRLSFSDISLMDPVAHSQNKTTNRNHVKMLSYSLGWVCKCPCFLLVASLLRLLVEAAEDGQQRKSLCKA